jgi:hypothetical protein
MNTSVFEAYSAFTDELQLTIEKTGTGIGVISLKKLPFSSQKHIKQELKGCRYNIADSAVYADLTVLKPVFSSSSVNGSYHA